MSSVITTYQSLEDSFERLKQSISIIDKVDINEYNEDTNDLISSIRSSKVPGATIGLSFLFRDRYFPDWYKVKPVDHIEHLHLWKIDEEITTYESRVKTGIRNKALPLLGVRLHYAQNGRALAFLFPTESSRANALVSGNGEKPELYMRAHISDRISK